MARIAGVDLPKEKRIDIIISMGYPESGAAKEKPRKNLNEIRRFNLG